MVDAELRAVVMDLLENGGVRSRSRTSCAANGSETTLPGACAPSRSTRRSTTLMRP